MKCQELKICKVVADKAFCYLCEDRFSCWTTNCEDSDCHLCPDNPRGVFDPYWFGINMNDDVTIVGNTIHSSSMSAAVAVEEMADALMRLNGAIE